MEGREARLPKLGPELVVDHQRPHACCHEVSCLEALVGSTSAVRPGVDTDGQAFHMEEEQNVCSWPSSMLLLCFCLFLLQQNHLRLHFLVLHSLAEHWM